MQNLETIVVRVVPKHPTQHRNRAGFKFTGEPTAIKVTPEQRKEIEQDTFLLVYTSGNSFEQGVARMKKDGDEEVINTPSSENLSSDDNVNTGNDETLANDDNEENSSENEEIDTQKEEVVEDNGFDKDLGGKNNGTPDGIEDYTQPQIVKLLIQKGLVAGKDFNKNAKKQDLRDLLITN